MQWAAVDSLRWVLLPPIVGLAAIVAACTMTNSAVHHTTCMFVLQCDKDEESIDEIDSDIDRRDSHRMRNGER